MSVVEVVPVVVCGGLAVVGVVPVVEEVPVPIEPEPIVGSEPIVEPGPVEAGPLPGVDVFEGIVLPGVLVIVPDVVELSGVFG